MNRARYKALRGYTPEEFAYNWHARMNEALYRKALAASPSLRPVL